MALSGSVDFALTRAQVVQSAYEMIDMVAVGDAIPGELVDQASIILGMMLKAWNADGLHLWKEYEGILFPVIGQQSYQLGPSGDRACLQDDYVRTTVNGNQTVTTSLLVTDSTGMAISDAIGIEISGALTWTTISNIVGNTLTIPTLGGVSVLDGATVVSYTTLIERPTRILQARRILNGTNEAPINIISREEYFRLTLKSSQGKVTQLYYDPKLTKGKAYIWPTFDSPDDVVAFTFDRQIQDMDAANNDFDLPPEWLEAVTWGLAARLTTYHHLPAEIAADIKTEAAMKKQELLAFDQEITSVQLTPSFMGRRY
jgi:hypothetical protein